MIDRQLMQRSDNNNNYKNSDSLIHTCPSNSVTMKLMCLKRETDQGHLYLSGSSFSSIIRVYLSLTEQELG